MNFCGNCGSKMTDGSCGACTEKSTNGLSMETLEKSLEALESLSKGVRPAEAKKGEGDERTAKKVVEDAKDQAHKYGDKGEGDSEEQPKSKKGVESAAKGGFVPPDEEQFEGDEDGEEEGQKCPPQMPMKSAGKKAKKSFSDEALEQEPIKKAVDVSEFLEGLVYQLGEFNDELRSDVNKSIEFAGYQQKFNVGLAKALGEVGTFMKSLAEKVETVGKTPAAVRKSDQTAATIEKSFAGGNATTNNNLTKGQIANKLLELMDAGDKSITESDVVRAEASGAVRAELRAKLGIEQQ
jgi:hypothetical protein